MAEERGDAVIIKDWKKNNHISIQSAKTKFQENLDEMGCILKYKNVLFIFRYHFKYLLPNPKCLILFMFFNSLKAPLDGSSRQWVYTAVCCTTAVYPSVCL